MNKKIIATILALGMVATAFAMMAAPVNAANYHGWWFIDNVGGDLRIRDSNGGVSPNGGSARFWKPSEPTYYMQNFNTPGGLPWVGMSDWIGVNGQSATDYAAFMQTTGAAGPSDVLLGDTCAFVLEMDANVTLEPRVYYSTIDGPAGYGWTQRGTTPNGYIWAGTDTASASPDDEVIPGTSPATTFYEMYQMPQPSAAANIISWSFPAHEADVIGNTVARIQSWVLMEGPAAEDNNGPWTSVGTAAYGSTITYTPQSNFYYCVRVIWVGPVNSPVLSQAKKLAGGVANVAPVVTAAASAPTPHNGNTVTEFVTLTATATDADSAPSPTILQYSIDAGAWTTFTSPYQFNFPNGYTEGLHHVDVRAYDGDLYSVVVAADFTITDTTAPVITTNSVPGATIYANQPATFTIGYGDFRPYNPAIGSSYFRYRVGAGAWVPVTWTNLSFAWGSYTNILTYTIPGGTFVAGNVITYEGRVTDTAATPNLGAWVGGSFTVLAAAAGVQDPYPIYGRLYLYTGTFAGGYAPLISAGGPVVTATWVSSATGLPITRTDTTNALGQFSIDLLNYTNGATVMLTATFDAPYNNAGSNYTTIDIFGAPGGRYQNVVCGVPYTVVITVPAPASIQTSGVAFAATYQIRDRAGLLAQGYYTFADGNMAWFSGDVAFVPPASTQFNGLGGGNGVGNNLLTLFSGGLQWINISEGGKAELNMYPTPWANFQVMTGFAGGVPVFANGWLRDYDNITVNVQAGGFAWRVVVGWNMVSVPQDPVNKGGNGNFDAFDALNYCRWQLPGVTVLSLADRVPGNPSTYNMFDYGQPEAGAFDMDGVHGYWVLSNVAGICLFNSTNYSAGANVVNAAAGWNLLGFTHNFTPWTVQPTAQQFTNGAVSATLGIGVGGNTKIVATQWLFATQWYNSYVVTTTFPGMATHNWVWDNAYAAQPGNGYFLWLTAATVITFNVNY